MTWWQALIAGLLTVAGSWLAARSSGRAAVRVAEVAADAEAFARAKGIYNDSITLLEKNLASVKTGLDVERKERVDMGNRVTALEASVRHKTERIALLEGDFDVLVPELIEWDAWIEQGANPPPPTVSEAAKKVMQHHRRRRAHLIRLDPDGNYREAPDVLPPD